MVQSYFSFGCKLQVYVSKKAKTGIEKKDGSSMKNTLFVAYFFPCFVLMCLYLVL